MPPRSLVTIGASAGGVEALLRLVSGLPADLPAAVCVVVHQPPRAHSFLPRVLTHAGPLPAVQAEDGAVLQPGHIYVAAPNAHLVVQADRLRLLDTARENGHRPAIDPLFRSAARSYGGAAVGVVLSGSDDDGTQGLIMLKARGGVVFVQDPAEALFPQMPASALAHVPVDAVLPSSALGEAIAQVVTGREHEGDSSVVHPQTGTERERADREQRITAWQEGSPVGSSSGLSCPLCGGGIWIGQEGPLRRFHCHTGHEFSQESFLQEQAMVLETTLWQALRALSEREALLRRLAHQEASTGSSRLAEQADELAQGLKLLRQLLHRDGSLHLDDGGAP